MRKMKRAIHIDFHTMPGITDLGTGYTAAQIAETLKGAHVDYVNVFARCNIGFSYYPTKVGTPYPGLDWDLLGETIEECHKRDIGVSAYFNAGLNHQLLLDHPEFSRVDRQGRIMRDERLEDNFFRSPCLNTGYREYLFAEIKEVIAKGPDGLFLDSTHPVPCYCSSCLRKMRAKGLSWENDQDVAKFAFDTQVEAFQEVRDFLPKEMRLYLNGLEYDKVADIDSHAEVECLPNAGWGYDFLPIVAPYYRKLTKNRVYMTGRFISGWGEFGSVKQTASLENDVFDALLYGYVPSIGDHMHPRDGLDPRLYDRVGKIYEYVESLEPWTDDTQALAQVAIVGNRHEGAARMLGDLKICYDVLNEDMDFDGYKLLIVPEYTQITPKLGKKLEDFGGAVISCADSIAPGGIWDYITSYETIQNKDRYYSYHGETWLQGSVGIRMKSGHALAGDVEPYFERKYDGFHGYFYNPPKGETGYCAVAKCGNKAHIGFKVFEAYQKFNADFHRDLVRDLIDELLPEKLLVTDLPYSARASLMRGPKGDVLHIKATHPVLGGGKAGVDEHDVLPAGRTVSVLGEYGKALRLPDLTPVESVARNGRTELVLPEITGYMPILLCQ